MKTDAHILYLSKLVLDFWKECEINEKLLSLLVDLSNNRTMNVYVCICLSLSLYIYIVVRAREFRKMKCSIS